MTPRPLKGKLQSAAEMARAGVGPGRTPPVRCSGILGIRGDTGSLTKMAIGTFPFGHPVRHLVQTDRAPKRVCVLGAFASAVHGRWYDTRGKLLVTALGVASEPCLFWRGEGVENILSGIDVPPFAGVLRPSVRRYNGPCGRSIDRDYLEPLGLARKHAWLCNLVQHSCMNARQADAVSLCYAPLAQRYGLPFASWPASPENFTDGRRRETIAAEVLESTAEVLITLGDLPLEWFANFFGSHATLRAYGHDPASYGQVHELKIHSRTLGLLPLAHPRQARVRAVQRLMEGTSRAVGAVRRSRATAVCVNSRTGTSEGSRHSWRTGATMMDDDRSAVRMSELQMLVRTQLTSRHRRQSVIVRARK